MGNFSRSCLYQASQSPRHERLLTNSRTARRQFVEVCGWGGTITTVKDVEGIDRWVLFQCLPLIVADICKNCEEVWLPLFQNWFIYGFVSRSQRPRGLRRRSAAARLLRLWVRIPPGTCLSVCCECCVLLGRGLCDGLITRPEESYRLWCVVVCDLETSRMRRPWPALGCSTKKKFSNHWLQEETVRAYILLFFTDPVHSFIASTQSLPPFDAQWLHQFSIWRPHKM